MHNRSPRPEGSLSSQQKWILGAILLFAFSLRLALSLYWNRSALGLAGDEFANYFKYDSSNYVLLGHYFAETGDLAALNFSSFYPTFRAPGYPFLLAIWFRLFGTNLSIFFLHALLGTTVVYMVYSFGLELCRVTKISGSSALLGALISLFWPALVIESGLNPASDPLYLILLLSTMKLGLRTLNRQKEISHARFFVFYVLSVLLGLCAIYVRPQGIMWLGALVLATIFLAQFPHGYIRRLVVYSAIAGALFLILIAPWIYRNYQLTNRLIFIAENVILFEQNNETFLTWPFLDYRYMGRGGLSQDRSDRVNDQLAECREQHARTVAVPSSGDSLFVCYNQLALQFIRGHPLVYMQLALTRFIKFLMPTPIRTPASGLSAPYSVALALAWLVVYPSGAVFLWRNRLRPKILFFVHLPIFLEILLAALIGTQLRYRLPTDMLMIAAASIVLWPSIQPRFRPLDAINLSSIAKIS